MSQERTEATSEKYLNASWQKYEDREAIILIWIREK